MLLNQIITPASLREMSYEELDVLAEEIRAFVVDAVTTHGGHLGSNLGAVELTLALHRVFNSPTDALLWDTGHQAYVHKIVTGRARQFEQLRKPGGLSGYPSREESAHDWVENSHASTSLSYAHGLGTAFRAAEARGAERRRVVAVIGDGSMTGGMAFEGLNNLGHSNLDVVIIFNDNGRSYAPTVSRLGERLARLQVNPTFVQQQERVERILGDLPLVGDHVDRVLDAVKAGVRELSESPSFFEDLGVRYTGPFDGHDIRKLERSLRHAAELKGPVVVHVLTQKGRGYAPAEQDPIKRMHDTSSMKSGSYTEAFTEALCKEAEVRPNVVAITAAMPDSTGLLAFQERFPDRCIDVGIAEQHAVTAAAGMAMGGLRPVVAIYSTFLTRAFDQVNLDVGLHRQPVVFCLDRAGITGDDGPSHHGILDMALLTKVPGMCVMAPSSYQEMEVMLAQALDMTEGPVTIRWPKTEARQVPENEVGRGLAGRKLRSGTDVCLLSVGKMLDAAEEAAERLGDRGVSVSVWDVRVVAPLDPVMLHDAFAHSLVVTVEDGIREGGAGSGIASALSELDGDGKAPPVRTLGIPTAYLPHGKPDEILAACGLDAAGIAQTALRALG